MSTPSNAINDVSQADLEKAESQQQYTKALVGLKAINEVMVNSAKTPKFDAERFAKALTLGSSQGIIDTVGFLGTLNGHKIHFMLQFLTNNTVNVEGWVEKALYQPVFDGVKTAKSFNLRDGSNQKMWFDLALTHQHTVAFLKKLFKGKIVEN